MQSTFRDYFGAISDRWNVYLSTFLNILLVYFLYTLTRGAFLLFNAGFFPMLSFRELLIIFLGGLRFDTSAILYTNLLYLLLALFPFTIRYSPFYQKVLKGIFVVTNSIALAANCADFIYFRFTLRRTTATVFREFGHETNFGEMVWEFFLDYWYVFLIWLLLTILLFRGFRKASLKKWPSGLSSQLVYSFNGLVLMVLFFGLMIGGMRGGFRHSTRPITLSNAGQYIKEPLETAIVLNTPFSIIRTLRIKPLPDVRYFDTEESITALFDPVHTPRPEEQFRPLNVVILLMESFGREYIGAYNPHLQKQGYTGYTPFLDSLIGESLVFRYSFSNGRKSIDALPSIFSSIPMLVEPFVLTPYSSNRINSLASLLNRKGYHSSFFHGAPNGSMGLLAFTRTTGFAEYYGMNEYGNGKDFDGMWGIWDHRFFNFFAETLNGFSQPFCTGIFSVSSHHPFKIPAEFAGMFPEGNHPIHEGIGYTDHVLRKFFDKVKETAWYENTLFVITADHPNVSFFPEYRTCLGGYTVPLIFYHPGGELRGMRPEIAQQIDILPSVLGYLNYDEPFVAFGRNVFDPGSAPFAVNYSNANFQLVQGDFLLVSGVEGPKGLYNFKYDSLLVNNMADVLEEQVFRMDQFLRAFIQQYNHRMIHDKLLVE
jgi:hypothetical protein